MRLIKNRESASLSRRKKKEVNFIKLSCSINLFLLLPQYVQNLEAKLKEAACKNAALLKENESLRSTIVKLKKEVTIDTV